MRCVVGRQALIEAIKTVTRIDRNCLVVIDATRRGVAVTAANGVWLQVSMPAEVSRPGKVAAWTPALRPLESWGGDKVMLEQANGHAIITDGSHTASLYQTERGRALRPPIRKPLWRCSMPADAWRAIQLCAAIAAKEVSRVCGEVWIETDGAGNAYVVGTTAAQLACVRFRLKRRDRLPPLPQKVWLPPWPIAKVYRVFESPTIYWDNDWWAIKEGAKLLWGEHRPGHVIAPARDSIENWTRFLNYPKLTGILSAAEVEKLRVGCRAFADSKVRIKISGGRLCVSGEEQSVAIPMQAAQADSPEIEVSSLVWEGLLCLPKEYPVEIGIAVDPEWPMSWRWELPTCEVFYVVGAHHVEGGGKNGEG